MRDMGFKAWLEGIEEYDPYRGRVDATARSFAFRHLFVGADESGRVFLPFVSEGMSDEDRKALKDIAEALADAHKEDPREPEYEVVDLKGGYARAKGRNNLVKIGKLLDTLKYKANKRNDARLAAGELSRLKHMEERRVNDSYYDGLKSDFENMAYRAGSELEVVVSMNPHDIASMSTGRGWTSCMNLKDGGHKRDVYCEVAYGGFVAYLVRKGDREVEKPIARVHIRRFDSKSGRSVAVPEETVYGTEKPGFMEAVRGWLERMQGRVEAGSYRRMGGEYSDTFGSDKRHFVRPDPQDSKKVMGWINKWLRLDKEAKAKHWEYFAQAMASLVSPGGGQYPEKFLVKVRDYIFGKRKDGEAEFGREPFEGGSLPVKGRFNQDCNQYVPSFAIRFPAVITRDHFVHAFTYAANHRAQVEMLDRLAAAFPQYADKDMIKATRDSSLAAKVAEKVPSLSGHHLAMLEDEFTKGMSVDNPRFSVWDSREKGLPGRGDITGAAEVQNNVTSEMDKLQHFKPIPERLVSRLIDFVNNRGDLKLVNGAFSGNDYHESEATKTRDAILRHALHVLGMTQTDTPSVQRFYTGLLQRWEEAGGIGRLGWAMARMGENARQFLPFLKEKRAEIEKVDLDEEMKSLRNPMGKSWFEGLKERTLEAFDHVIHTIESGSHSSKYKMEYGEMLDSYLYDQRIRDAKQEFFMKNMMGRSPKGGADERGP